jgi:hypothetical protein
MAVLFQNKDKRNYQIHVLYVRQVHAGRRGGAREQLGAQFSAAW